MINPHADDTYHVWSHLTHTYFSQWNLPIACLHIFLLYPKYQIGCYMAMMGWNLRLSAKVQKHISIRTALPTVWSGGLLMNVPTPGCKSLLIYWLHSFHSK